MKINNVKIWAILLALSTIAGMYYISWKYRNEEEKLRVTGQMLFELQEAQKWQLIERDEAAVGTPADAVDYGKAIERLAKAEKAAMDYGIEWSVRDHAKQAGREDAARWAEKEAKITSYRR